MSLLGPRLEAFLSVHKQKSVTQAAKELNITQTGVTQRIRSLEKELGVTLFLRSRRGMEITAEGQHLLNYCEEAGSRETELISMLVGEEHHPIRVCISGPSSIMKWRVVPVVFELLKVYAWLRFQIDFSDTSSGVEALRFNKSQLALVSISEVTLELDSKILKPQRYFLAVPTAWKNRAIEDIVEKETIVDYDHEDQMTFDYLKKYDLKPPPFVSRHLVNNPEAIADFIKAGAGYSVLTENLWKSLPKNCGITILKPHQFFDYRIALAWYPRSTMPGYFREIVKAIR